MKDPSDKNTAKRGRGRPPKADALSPAERAKRYRERQAARLADVDPIDDLIQTLRELPAVDRRRIVAALRD